MTTLLEAGRKTTVLVPIGQVLTVTRSRISNGRIYQIAPATNGQAGPQITYNGAPIQLGPYDNMRGFQLECDAGHMDYSIAQQAGADSLAGRDNDAIDVSQRMSLRKQFLGAGGLGIGGKRIAANKCGVLGGLSTTALSSGNGTELQKTYRQLLQTPVGAGMFNPSLVFANWNVVGTGEADGPNDITIKAFLEYNGASYPLIFKGNKVCVLGAGAQIETDPLGIYIPPNTDFFVRTHVIITSTQQWPVGRLPHTGSGEGGNAAAAANGSDAASGTGALAGNANTYMYGPIACLGYPEVYLPTLGLFGDSIGAGSNDTTVAKGFVGFMERLIGNTYAWHSNTRSSTKLADFISLHTKRLAFHAQFMSTAIMELGTNDIFSDLVNLATFQTRAIAAWRILSHRGIEVWQTTLTPRPTGTFTTLEGQTVGAANAVKNAANDWIRAGAPLNPSDFTPLAQFAAGAIYAGAVGHPLTGYLEVADVVESDRNSGKWRIDLGTPTSDGVHPSAILHTEIVSRLAGRVAEFN